MRNHVTDGIADQALEYLFDRFRVHFKIFVFVSTACTNRKQTANDLTQVPTFLIGSKLTPPMATQIQTNVKELMLSRNKFTAIDLAMVLGTLPSLEVLDLSQNEIRSLNPDARTGKCTSNVKK